MKRVLFLAVAVVAIALPFAATAQAAGFDLPQVTYPKDNPYSPGKVELGKKLFFDPRLSGSNIMSCATCHNPGLGWADGMALAKGHNMMQLGRHTPTIINSAHAASQFWDGRAATLEEQAKGPILAAGEMNQDEAELMAELASIPDYKREFERLFPKEGISLDTVVKAIATFEREVVSSSSGFDRYMHGDKNAISASAERGWNLYRGKGQCLKCHSGPNLSDGKFHDIGVDDGDEGRFAVTQKKRDKFRFKTPTVRDAARTAPYLHNGQEATLLDLVKFYDRGGDRKPNELAALNLTDAEMADLVEFMKALTGPPVLVTIPQLP